MTTAKRPLILLALFALLVLACAERASAQTISRTMRWGQPNTTLAEVQALVYTSQVDNAPAVLVTPTCVAGTPVTCSAPITFTSGPHTITLTASNAFGSTSASITGAPPSAPVSVTVTISVTVP
jgi:hypothetical protein